MMKRWGDLLESLPTEAVGQAADLKIQTRELRVWLARTGIEDGEPFASTVYVEQLVDRCWRDVGYFDGDEPDPHPAGVLGDAWRATLEALPWECYGCGHRLPSLVLGWSTRCPKCGSYELHLSDEAREPTRNP